MVGRGGAMVMVMVMVMVVVAAVRAEGDTCSTLKVLGTTCKSDEGPPKPGDGQTVYLKHPYKQGNWWYPKWNFRINFSDHPIRTITETKSSWAKWIWLDCGEGYVCLESGRYPHYYIGDDRNWGIKYIYYSTDPKRDDRIKMEPLYEKNKSKLPLVKLTFKMFKPRSNLHTYLYIPPRCEGYKKVNEVVNQGSMASNFTYKFQTGVTLSKLSNNKKLSSTIIAEVTRGIYTASLNGSFSTTWKHETSTVGSKMEVHENIFQIPPRKSMTVWQLVARYGMYEWRSNTFITCEEDLDAVLPTKTVQ